MVRPLGVQCGDGSGLSIAESPIQYEFRASRALPRINCATLLVHRILPRGLAARYICACDSTQRLCRVSSTFGLALIAVAPFLQHRFHLWATWLSAALVTPPLVRAYSLLQIDMLKLLLKTYEFWYFSVTSVLSCAMISINFGDARALTTICHMLVFGVALTLDASTHDTSSAVAAAALGAVAVTSLAFAQAFGLMEEYEDMHLATTGDDWDTDSSEVIVNQLVVMVVVMVRNAYRRFFRSAGVNCGTRCISYRVQIQLVELATIDTAKRSLTQDTTTRPALALHTRPSTTQLFLLPIEQHFDARATILKCQTRSPPPPLLQKMWTVVGMIGLGASVAAVLRSQAPVLAYVGVICSGLYTTRYWPYHNRLLLGHMVRTFDFYFVTTQAYMGHVLLCFMLRSEPTKLLPVVSSLFWVHWVFTLDVVGPSARQNLGRGAIMMFAPVVLVLAIISECWLAADILYGHHWQLQDLMLVRLRLGDRYFKFSALSFLLTRTAKTTIWCSRLLWRLRANSENALLMIQGTVEYGEGLVESETSATSK